MNKIYLLLVFLFLILSANELTAQTIHPSKVVKSVYSDQSEKLKDIEPVPFGLRNKLWKNQVVPNKFNFDQSIVTQYITGCSDPVVQQDYRALAGEPVVVENFPGVSNNYGVAPPDTDGDVGPNHYFQMVNLGMAIWDKEGNKIYGPVDNITLWSGFPGPWQTTNDGDPVVIYDEYADRWVASQFALPNYPYGPFYELVAVSQTGDPTGAWNRYAFEFDHMPDYPKLSVWPDGYYLTVNQFLSGSGNWGGAAVCVLDRQAMIDGEEDAEMIFFDMGTGYGSLLPADADGPIQPAEDSPAWMVNLGAASLRIWGVEVDWENTDNSTISLNNTVPVEYYNSNGISISQPGTGQSLDNLADRLMFRLQYRNFGDYQVMLTNHTVNANGNGKAGVRWYELRNEGNGWFMYQQATYAPDDGNSRWMGSIAMNDHGDIALGFSVSSSSTYPSIRVVMQSAEKLMGLGMMDIAETTIKPGAYSQTGIGRWGDYSTMTVDPSDGNTFWFTTEFTSGSWSWKTQIASFFYVQPLLADFTSEETVIPVGETLNFTDLTTGTPDEWNWTFEGGNPPTSSEHNPQNISYSQEGTYKVSLQVSNEYGNDIEEKEAYITVSSAVLPDVEFESDKILGCTIDTVKFIDLSNHKPIQWLWQFEPNDITFVNGTNESSASPQVVFNSNTAYDVSLQVWNLNGSSEMIKTDFIQAGGIVPYYIEKFTDTSFFNQYWTIENPESDNYWRHYIVAGNDFDFDAAGINFKDFNAVGHRDRLISPPFNLSGMSSASLEFEHAFAKRLSKQTDSLLIYVSGDCGFSWTQVFTDGEDGSGNFATHEITNDFWPDEESDWCLLGWGASCISIDLTPWAGMPNVKIAFEGYNNYGNTLFIDNVSISQFVGQNELISDTDMVLVYPNPVTTSFTVELPEEHNFEKLQVINNLSQVVYKTKLNKENNRFEIKTDKNWKPGIYLLQLGGTGKTVNKKIIVK